MNFGETLAYWYLRLNGFFPLSNLVLHRYPSALEYSADCDLLALRLPHTFEDVGGQGDDWDPRWRDTWKIVLGSSGFRVGFREAAEERPGPALAA